MKTLQAFNKSILLVAILFLAAMSFGCSQPSQDSTTATAPPSPSPNADPPEDYSHMTQNERIRAGLDLERKVHVAKFLIAYYKQLPTEATKAPAYSGADFRQLADLAVNDPAYGLKIKTEIGLFKRAIEEMEVSHDRVDGKTASNHSVPVRLELPPPRLIHSRNYRVVKAVFRRAQASELQADNRGQDYVPSTKGLESLHSSYQKVREELWAEARKPPAIQLAANTKSEDYRDKSQSIALHLLNIIADSEAKSPQPLEGEGFQQYLDRVNKRTGELRNRLFRTSETPKSVRALAGEQPLTMEQSRYLAEQSKGMREIKKSEEAPSQWKYIAEVGTPEFKGFVERLSSKELPLEPFEHQMRETTRAQAKESAPVPKNNFHTGEPSGSKGGGIRPGAQGRPPEPHSEPKVKPPRPPRIKLGK